MNSPMRPPLSSIVPENAPFTPEQRVWLNGFFAGLSVDGGRHCAIAAGELGAVPDVSPVSSGRRFGGRRRALARSDLAARRANEACRGPPCTAEDDGGDGAAGLRPVRLQLQGLCECAVQQERGTAEPLRARRQGNRPHAEGVAVRDRARAPAPAATKAPDAAATTAEKAAGPLPAPPATIPSRQPSYRARVLNKKGSRRRPGTLNSI